MKGNADAYSSLTITYVKGHAPTLFLYKGGEQIEEILIGALKVEEIHDLLTSKGFTRNLKGSS